MAVTKNSIITPQTPKSWTALTTTANTDLTATASGATLLITAGANGARVTVVNARPIATNTLTALQLFSSKDGGTTRRLIKTKAMAAYTVANTTEIPEVDFGYSDELPLTLEADEQIFVGNAVTQAGGIVWRAEGGNY
jgi:hypothetical protein